MYPAKPLPSTGQQFRILTLQPSEDDKAPLACHLETCSLNRDAPPFTAISYAWGSQRAEKGILCDGVTLRINDNLERALLICRSTQEALCFWVDQICVNQQDVSEKNHQVPQMGRIFKKAQKVIGWLGEPDETTSDLAQYADWVLGRPFFDGEVHFAMPQKRLNFTQRSNRNRGRQALFQLLQGRDWFKRSWIVQEAAAQRQNLRLHLGQYTFSYNSLLIVVLFTNDDIKARLKHVPYERPHPLGWRSVLTPLVFCPAIEMANNSQGLNRLSLLVSHFSLWGASDPRDKIYAFLALSVDAGKYEQPDYDLSYEVVYRQFASTTIRQGLSSLMPYLTFAAQTRSFPTQPSWVADWTTLEDDAISSMRNNTAFRAGGSIDDIQEFSFNGDTICLPGVIKAKVDVVSPAYRPSSASSGSFGHHWLSTAVEHVRMSRKRALGKFPAAGRSHHHQQQQDVDPGYEQDTANLLVLDGKSSLYQLSGDEAWHFQKLREQLVKNPSLCNQPAAWDTAGSLTVSVRCMPAQMPQNYASALTSTDGHAADAQRVQLGQGFTQGIDSSEVSNGNTVTKIATIEDHLTPRPLAAPLQPVLSDPNDEKDAEGRGFAEYSAAMRAIVSSQGVMTLDNGTLGLGNWKARSGDVVAVLVGARLPFILRPTETDGRYTLISEAYVRGMMSDAVVSERDSGRLQKIVIC